MKKLIKKNNVYNFSIEDFMQGDPLQVLGDVP